MTNEQLHCLEVDLEDMNGKCEFMVENQRSLIQKVDCLLAKFREQRGELHAAMCRLGSDQRANELQDKHKGK